MQPEDLFRQIESLKPEMITALMKLVSVPAVGPENGGEGESKKSKALTEILQNVGFDKIENYDAEDHRVPSGKRPNIVAYCNGETGSPKLWIISHLDVVPAGEEAHWKVTKPFEPVIIDNKVYGRGSADNGQSVISAIFAIKALKQMGIKPKRTVALAFVADEEQGSTKGIQHLISKGLFNKTDLVVVPDSGEPDGSFIEIAEKGILWFKVVTVGKQTHGSIPTKGLNAHRIGMQVSLALDEVLHAKYSLKNYYFTEPTSTFEPTRKEKNVDAVNVIPGEDVVYFDCRVLPNYSLDEVLSDVHRVVEEFQQKTGVTIKIEIMQKQDASTIDDGDAEVIVLLKKAIKQVRGLDPEVGGIGGGTCAAFFRKNGVPAVVWSSVDEVAHQPDEYTKIQNMIDDAKVFAFLAVL